MGTIAVSINGSWVIFDFGFDPWWPYWYPYDYYGYGYYGDPYAYDSSYYDEGAYGGAYSDQNGYADQSTSSIVAAAQERLAREGYYRGQIDGIVGPETRRAVARYQGNHGLRWRGILQRRQRRSHDPMLVLNMSIFNFSDGWERIFNPFKVHEHGTR